MEPPCLTSTKSCSNSIRRGYSVNEKAPLLKRLKRFLPGLFLGILKRISAGFVSRHEPGVVFEQVVQVLGIGGKNLAGIRIRLHGAKRQRLNRISAVGIEVHILFVSVGDEEIVAHPSTRQCGQFRWIEIERNLVA